MSQLFSVLSLVHSAAHSSHSPLFNASSAPQPLPKKAVVFLVQAKNHLREALSTQKELAHLNQASVVVMAAAKEDRSSKYRVSFLRTQRVTDHAAAAGLDLSQQISRDELVDLCSALVVWNDWGPSNELIKQMQLQAIPTIGWVEGVQDFDDADTGRERHAYQSVDHVFCLGDYDYGILSQKRADIYRVGSQRIWDIWHSPPTHFRNIPVLINLNFTYDVKVEHRRKWASKVIRATEESGRHPTISRHPADRGLSFMLYESPKSIDWLLPRSRLLISRFSTAIYDALALRTPVIYFNPDLEDVATFSEPAHAFSFATDTEQLHECLSRTSEVDEAAIYNFLSHHLTLSGLAPQHRSADLINTIIGSRSLGIGL